MKKIFPLIVALILGALGWMVYQHQQTGKWSLTPVTLTPREQKLRALKFELSEINAKIATEGRVSGMAGTGGSLALDEYQNRKRKLEDDIQRIENGGPLDPESDD